MVDHGPPPKRDLVSILDEIDALLTELRVSLDKSEVDNEGD
jgi:hypothetical protein